MRRKEQGYAEREERGDRQDEHKGCKIVQVKKEHGKTKGKAMRSPFDVNGSYTGTPQDGEKPVQDADDL